LKNKPKIGNSSENKPNIMRLARKFNRIKNRQENYIEKQGDTSENPSPHLGLKSQINFCTAFAIEALTREVRTFP